MKRSDTAYSAVASGLRKRILDGRIQPGEQLPTERELCDLYRTSRITVRRALQILEEERLVSRRQGSGTFVSPRLARSIPIVSMDFFGSVVRHAPELKRRLLEWGWRPAGTGAAEALGLEAGDKLLFASRVDVLDGKPVAFDTVYIRECHARNLGARELRDVDFLDRWGESSGVRLSYCRQTVEAVAAKAETARVLGIRPGDPVLKESDVVFTPDDEPAGLFVSRYRWDRFQLITTFPVGRRAGKRETRR